MPVKGFTRLFTLHKHMVLRITRELHSRSLFCSCLRHQLDHLKTECTRILTMRPHVCFNKHSVFVAKYLNATRCLCSKPRDNSTSPQASTTPPPPPLKVPRPTNTNKLRDLEAPYEGNTRIPEERVYYEYLLEAKHVAGLPCEEEREPYSDTPDVIVTFAKSDVEQKAKEVHGSLENLEEMKLNREKTIMFGHGPRGSSRSEILRQSHPRGPVTKDPWGNTYIPIADIPEKRKWLPGEKVALSAIAVNFVCFGVKLACYSYTGSSSVFSEVFHSLADLTNQIFLYYGLRKSYQAPDLSHPYGWANMRYVASLISGVAIFSGGACVSIYHSLHSLLNLTPVTDPALAIGTMIAVTLLESITFLFAYSELKKASEKRGIPFKQYVLRNEHPTTNVVLFEDGLAVLSTVVASLSLAASLLTGLHWLDPVGGLCIGFTMAAWSCWLIKVNVNQLNNTSISQTEQRAMIQYIESDPVIKYIRDVKTTDLGGVQRFKAEYSCDGRLITQIYLDKQDMNALFNKAQAMKSSEDLENFLLEQGSGIVEQSGDEINRIERRMKRKFPNLRHVDLEPI